MQCIFYHKQTFTILRVVPFLRIRYAGQKKIYIPSVASRDVGVFYYPHRFPVIDLDYVLVPGDRPNSFHLLSPDRQSVHALYYGQYFNSLLHPQRRIFVYFEGGLGDHILQLQAVASASHHHPQQHFFCVVRDDFLSFAPLWPNVSFIGRSSRPADKSNSPNSLIIKPFSEFDPRGGHYGKKDMYGLFFGLSEVNHKPAVDDFYFRSLFSTPDYIALKRSLPDNYVIIHAHSSSGSAKCLKPDFVSVLCDQSLRHHRATPVIVGSPAEAPPDRSDYISIPTVSPLNLLVPLIFDASAIYCCDSFIMHLSVFFSVPCHRFWSATSPDSVLGRPWSNHDHNMAWLPPSTEMKTNM